MGRTFVWTAALAALWLIPARRVRAHEGPPFPIVMDKRAGLYVISVWTDPDVGIEKGKFFVILQPAPGTSLPEKNEVEVCVRPTSGRLPEVCYAGTRQDLRDRVQYYAEVEFDRQEMWQVLVRVKGSAGVGEVSAEVEATPPGYGRWDLLIYGFPFILFGLLWGYAALLRRRDNAAPTPAGNAGGPEAPAEAKQPAPVDPCPPLDL
jgi:hypothetical protein